MKWNREEYIELQTFGKVDRQMFVELFGPLVGLSDEWRTQGATEDEINLTAFDFDYVDIVQCGGNTGIIGGAAPKILEETSEHIISTDKFGKQEKLMKGYAIVPLPLEYSVKQMDDWLKIKHWFEYSDERIDWDMVKQAKQKQKEGSLVIAWMEGGFDFPRQLMGEERTCMCYYDSPELMNDIMSTISDMTFKVLDKISDKLVIDNLCVHEDMAGKSGSLIGPNLISQHVEPYYKKIWDMLSSKGTKLFSQDSDGNMNSVIDSFLDSGVNIMYPAEPGSGMDIVELRKIYGEKLTFKGGIDKYVLQKDKKAILNELEYKLQPLMQKGGVVFGGDHRIPNGTSIENYRYYVDTAREILNIPPRGKNKGWSRMAF
ncbi:MAG: hypothetical protein KAQ68_00665 [Clostridiales bacterium]|nr:hypothetical protein [Clostridiales bacterium]